MLIGIGRHHGEGDKEYLFVFEFNFDKNDPDKWKPKLIPLDTELHLNQLHGYHKFKEGTAAYDRAKNKFYEDNAVAIARMTHLLELIYERSFNPNLPNIENPTTEDYYNYYKALFMEEFDKRIDKVNGMDYKIWAQVDSKILEDWTKRWVDKKRMSEKEWYNKYYSKFYGSEKKTGSYLSRIKFLKDKRPEFWNWYIKYYWSKNRYPSGYPSLT